MMQSYRKKTGVGRSAPPAGAQGGAMPQKGNPQRGGIVNMMGTQQGPSGQGAPAQGTVPGQQPNPQQLQKIFDIARSQGPQAVQQYVAQAHGPEAARALAAHPDVQQATNQLGMGRMQIPGAEPNDSFGGGGPATPGAPTPQAQGPLAPRYQQMIAAGQDPAAVAARAAQFRAGGLPGQQGAGSPSGPPMAQPPIHTMPAALPNPGGQGAPGFGGGQPSPMVNAGVQIPGVMAQQPPGEGGGFTKPFMPGGQPGGDPNDMRSMLAQRLRGMPLGYNAGGQNYQA